MSINKTVFILCLICTILVIVLPIEPKELGWILAIVCGWATGNNFIGWMKEESEKNKFDGKDADKG